MQEKDLKPENCKQKYANKSQPNKPHFPFLPHNKIMTTKMKGGDSPSKCQCTEESKRKLLTAAFWVSCGFFYFPACFSPFPFVKK